jgi:hypothetical protein
MYLRGLARLCEEVARQPRLLPVFVRVLAMAPATLRELLRRDCDQRRIAA